MKPDIILLSEFFPPTPGGIQRSLDHIATELGPRLFVVAPGGATDLIPSERRLARSLFSGRGRPSWFWLIPYLRQQRHARLFIFGHYSAAVMAGYILSWFGRRYAILIHGQDILSEVSRPGRRWFVRALVRRADWIGVNSTFTEKLVQSYGVRAWRIIRTHPTVVDSTITPSTTPADPPHLITICRLVARKNVTSVIKALALLRDQGVKFHYDIVGDGPEHEDLQLQVTQLGLGDHITLHGQVSEHHRVELLHRASIAVMIPTTLAQGSDIEGLGAFYLEAAAIGLPLIGSPTGGVPDIVINERTGYLVGPEDTPVLVKSIKELLNHPERREQFGQAAKQRITKEFSTTVRNDRLRRAIDPAVHGPKVSIIIPAFNTANSIIQTLDSIKRQSYQDWEIIVVDDGSTDALETTLAPWRNLIQYVRQVNQGAPVARNAGAALAAGDFLLFLDADTILKPEALTMMVNTLRSHPEASFVYSNFRFGPKGFRLHEFDAARLERINYIHTTSLLRRPDFPGFDPSLKKFQDWDLWLTLAAAGKSGVWINRELFQVRERSDGISHWLPSFVYRLPVIGRGRGNRTIAAYRQAEAVIRAKHRRS